MPCSLVELDAIRRSSSKRPHLVHPAGAQQFAQQRHQAGPADALGRAAADDPKLELRRRRRCATSSMAPSSAGMPQAMAPPSKAGPAGQEAARIRCLLPTISSVLVPISMMAIRRSSCARSDGQHAGRGVGADVSADDGSAVHARLGMDGQQAAPAGLGQAGGGCACPAAISISVMDRYGLWPME